MNKNKIREFAKIVALEDGLTTEAAELDAEEAIKVLFNDESKNAHSSKTIQALDLASLKVAKDV